MISNAKYVSKKENDYFAEFYQLFVCMTVCLVENMKNYKQLPLIVNTVLLTIINNSIDDDKCLHDKQFKSSIR